MRNPFRFLWRVFAGADQQELARQNEFLKAENEILRARLPACIQVTPQEKQRLLRLGKPLGDAIKGLISIVSPRTFLRWVRSEQAGPPRTSPTRAPGRPKTPAEIRDLVLELARENGWGSTRILGELKKLAVGPISRTTIRNILKEAGLEPGPKRGAGTWDDFVRRHLQTLWACDFFCQQVWTMRGLVDVFVLFFLHVGSRRVHIVGMTTNPDQRWMTQQARNIAMIFDAEGVKPRYLIRDNDGKFVPQFDAILQDEGIEILRIPPACPNMNPFAERFVGSVRSECLDHFVVFGEKHLRHLLTEYLAFYHQSRPHQGVGNVLLTGEPTPEPTSLKIEDVVCEERLGGLLKSYRRAA